MYTNPLEADTRVLIDTTLCNLGWQLTGTNKNVFFEQPKKEEEKKLLAGKRPDYVLYSQEDNLPLVVIEAKKKGEKIDDALRQGIFYAEKLKAPLVFATDGVFCKSYHTIGNTTPKLNGDDVDEFIREVTALKFLKEWNVNTVNPKVQYSRSELIKIFNEANILLRGDGLRAGIERFSEFANILFLKLISEAEQLKKEFGEESSFDKSCSWDAIKNISTNARVEYINTMVYSKLNALYNTEIFTPLLIRDNSILKEIIDKLDPLTLTDVDSDIKGDAFEYFLKESTSTKNDLGEYFTPRHIVKTMVRLVNPQIGEKVYDPFCGSGGFLIESFRHIYKNMPRNPATEKMLREETIYGNEITNTGRITKMNMILAGDGHSNIKIKDSLASPVEGEYDVVIANMPYAQKTKYGALYDLPSTNGDSICVQHCIKAINGLSENGRMALVVPEGFLFRKDLAKTREYLLERTQLQSIISLPQGVFLPYTSVKTNIIYATKVNQKLSSKNKRKNYWYFDVKSDGLSLDNHRRNIGVPSDLSKYEEYRKLDDEQSDEMIQVGFEVIPFDKVRENSFVLMGGRYRNYFSHLPLGNEKASLEEVLLTLETGKRPKGGATFEGVLSIGGEHINELGKIELSCPRYVPIDYFNNSKNGRIKQKDILMCKDGALTGKLAYLDFSIGDALANEHVFILRANEKILMQKFLYYYLNSFNIQNYIKEVSRKSAQPGLTRQDILKIQIVLPTLKEQKKLVDELDCYQQKIDEAKRNAEALEEKIKNKINQLYE